MLLNIGLTVKVSLNVPKKRIISLCRTHNYSILLLWIFLHVNLFREVVFDLIVEKVPLILGLKTLEDSITAILSVCFVANMEYPKVIYYAYLV